MLPISDANHTMGAVLTVSIKKKKTQLAGGRCPQARKKKREEKQSKERGGKNKRLYLSRAELSSSSRWASDVLPSLDRASILFIMTSNMSLIFLRTPRDSTPPSTGKDGEGEALGFTAEWRKNASDAADLPGGRNEVATVTRAK